MKGITRMRRRIGVAAIGLGLTAGLVVPAAPAEAFTKPPQAYGGFGSGVETFARLAPTAQLAKAQVAVARSAVNSQGLTNVTDELGNPISTANGDKAARALGQALDLNLLGSDVELVAPAIADAPPNTADAEDSLLEVPIPGLAFAEALEGRASARFNENGNICIIGADMANGRGQAANVQLLGSGLEPGGDGLTNPLISVEEPGVGERNAVNTISRQLLTAQVRQDGSIAGSKVGVLSEVTQTVAPVTIGTPGGLLVAIEVVGVYQLRAFAGGLPGTGFIEYNPATGGEAPVLSVTIPPTPGNILGDLLNPILSALPAEVQALVSFDPATGRLLIPLGPALELLQPVVDLLATLGIVIGEQPRAIGGGVGSAPLQRPDGTASAAAIDLVRIQPAGLLAPLAALAPDVRVGHMEVLAFAPAGGIDCPGLGVGKVTDKDPVQVGETFTYTIAVANPYDCILRNVRVQDDITASNGVTFTVGTTNPQASSVTPIAGGTRVVWNDIGPIPARGNAAVQVQVTVNSATSNGRISDTATVTADCATGGGTGTTNVNLNLSGSVTLNAPQVGGASVLPELPRTGRNDRLFLGFGLAFLLSLAGVEAIRRRSRNHD